MSGGISVKALLESKYLRNISRVAAGEKGLNKSVAWLHILEICDIVKECVDGHEMVLTTGIGFTSKHVAENFMKELIKQNVTALCIETALYYHEIDAELIELANKNDFPLIEITGISRFVDITRGLNTMILNHESRIYHSADNYDLRLSEIDDEGALADGIRYTAEYLNLEVAYFPARGRHFSTSQELSDGAMANILAIEDKLVSEEVYSKGKIAVKRLNVFGRNLGYLLFNSTQNDITQFDLMILSRLSNKIKNDIMRQMLNEEKRHYKSIEWIKDWVAGDLTKDQVIRRLKEAGIVGNFQNFIVCSAQLPKKNLSLQRIENEDGCASDDCFLFDDVLLHTSAAARKAFEEENLAVLGYLDKERISYIILEQEDAAGIFEKIKKAVGRLRTYENPIIDFSEMYFSVGKLGKSYMDIKRSYKTAAEILSSYEFAEDKLIIYENLSIGRVLRNIGRDTLEEFAEDYLKELLEKEHGELLQTLKTYFECSCSKQRTAERLYIVRQTLYFRLQKIEDILGPGYDEGEKRFATEFAIKAFFFLKMKDATDCIES